jgi:hypothetical protein
MAKRWYLFVSVMLGFVHAATAGPLTAEQCAKLTADVAALDKGGVKVILEKGPAVAKGSLSKEQRDQVRAYLDALGNLRFRCPNDAPLVALKPEPPDDPADAGAATAPIDANAPGITLPPGVAAAVVAPVVPKKPPVVKAPKAATPAGPAGTVAKTPPPVSKPERAPPPPVAPPVAKVQPKATAPAVPAQPAPATAAPVPSRPKPKPKVDDAFKPADPVPVAKPAP